MARTFPIFLVLITTYFGQLFPPYKGQHATGGPIKFSVVMIRLSLYFLLINSHLYMRHLRKLHPVPEFMFEYIFGLFIMESSLNYIWFPLENTFLTVIQGIYNILLYLAPKTGWIQSFIVNYAATHTKTLITCSYALSTIILFSILHATRCVDFRIIRRCGWKIFLRDASDRFCRKCLKYLPFLKRFNAYFDRGDHVTKTESYCEYCGRITLRNKLKDKTVRFRKTRKRTTNVDDIS